MDHTVLGLFRFQIETLFESSLSMSCECTEYELRYFSSACSSALTIIPRGSAIVFENYEQLPSSGATKESSFWICYIYKGMHGLVRHD